MNTQKKAQLRQVITELETIYEGELKATKKHKTAGEEAYEKHAAWCADGINEAIMLLKNKFPSEAVALLQRLADSSPTDALTPYAPKPIRKQKKLVKSSACSSGWCNHPEHL